MGEGEMRKGREGGSGGVKWCTEVRGSMNGMVGERVQEQGQRDVTKTEKVAHGSSECVCSLTDTLIVRTLRKFCLHTHITCQIILHVVTPVCNQARSGPQPFHARLQPRLVATVCSQAHAIYQLGPEAPASPLPTWPAYVAKPGVWRWHNEEGCRTPGPKPASA